MRYISLDNYPCIIKVRYISLDNYPCIIKVRYISLDNYPCIIKVRYISLGNYPCIIKVRYISLGNYSARMELLSILTNKLCKVYDFMHLILATLIIVPLRRTRRNEDQVQNWDLPTIPNTNHYIDSSSVLYGYFTGWDYFGHLAFCQVKYKICLL